MTERVPPSVSVVVPTRNRAELLPGLLAALERQDYPDFEVIVVDDASTDGTPALLAAWEGPSRMALRRDVSGGSYAARNLGWRAARGEIVAFTDDDCLPSLGWLSALTTAFQGQAVGVQGVTLAEPGMITPFTHQIDQRRPGEPYRTCNIAYRRSLLEQLGGFDESLRWYADNIFGLRTRQQGPIAFAPGAIVRHPPRPRDWRDRRAWKARFDADARHRAELHRLGVEPALPGSVLPVLLWVLRPLVKQSLFHLRYALRHPQEYLRGIVPMAGEKRELLAAMLERYRAPQQPGQRESLPSLPDEPMVSVVVVTRDRPALLQQTLEALRRQAWETREIVVVDHAGTLTLEGDDIRIVRCPDVTLGAARQAGVDAAAGHIIAFTDDDCLPGLSWISEIVSAFQAHPEWHGVQGRTCAAQGPLGSHAVRVDRPNRLYQTCNIAYRRDALKIAGGFDPDFQGWFEDTALGARVLEHGEIGFAPRALVTHQAVPRRMLDRTIWRRLLADEWLLARRYPAFYHRTRGLHPVMVITVRWLLGAPLKLLARELPRAFGDVRGYAALIVALLRERKELIRALGASSR